MVSRLFLIMYLIAKSIQWSATGHLITTQIAKRDLLQTKPEVYKYYYKLIK